MPPAKYSLTRAAPVLGEKIADRNPIRFSNLEEQYGKAHTEISLWDGENCCKRSGSLLPSDGQDSLMGGRLGGLEDNDLPTRLRDVDIEGIATSVLFPTSSLRVSQTMERDYAISHCRAYNDFISDIWKKNARLKAIGLVPFQNVIYDASTVVGEVNRMSLNG